MFKCFLSEHLSYAVHGFFDIQLLDLPHEILTQVVSELDCTDFLALTLCCKNLFVRLSNEQIFLHFQRLNSEAEQQARAFIRERNIALWQAQSGAPTTAPGGRLNALQVAEIESEIYAGLMAIGCKQHDHQYDHPFFQKIHHLSNIQAMLLKNMCHLGGFSECLRLLRKMRRLCLEYKSNRRKNCSPLRPRCSSDELFFLSMLNVFYPFHNTMVKIVVDACQNACHFARDQLARYLDMLDPSRKGPGKIVRVIASHCDAGLFVSTMCFLCERYNLPQGSYILEAAAKKQRLEDLKALMDCGFPVVVHNLIDIIAQQDSVSLCRVVLRLGLEGVQLSDVINSPRLASSCGDNIASWAYVVDFEPDLDARDAKYPTISVAHRQVCRDIAEYVRRQMGDCYYRTILGCKAKIPFVPLKTNMREAASALLAQITHFLSSDLDLSSHTYAVDNTDLRWTLKEDKKQMILKEEDGDKTTGSTGLYLEGNLQFSNQVYVCQADLSLKLYVLHREMPSSDHHHHPDAIIQQRSSCLTELLFHVISICHCHKEEQIAAVKLILACFAHQFPRLKKKTGIARAVSNSNCGEILLWMHRNHWAIDAKMVSYDCGLNGCLNVCHALDVLSLLDPEAMLRGAAHNGRLDTLGYSIVAGLFPEVKKNSAWWAAAVRNSHKAFLDAIRDRIGPEEEANVTYYAAQQQQYTLLEKLIQKYHYETDSRIFILAVCRQDYALLEIVSKYRLPMPEAHEAVESMDLIPPIRSKRSKLQFKLPSPTTNKRKKRNHHNCSVASV